MWDQAGVGGVRSSFSDLFSLLLTWRILAVLAVQFFRAHRPSLLPERCAIFTRSAQRADLRDEAPISPLLSSLD